jgi:IS605 OrfB family transposase
MAQAVIDSQLESDAAYLAYLEKKIARQPDQAQRHQAKLDAFQAERGERLVRPAVFGGRELWQQVQRRIPGAQETWRAARSNQFYSPGDSTCRGGNHHAQLEWQGDQAFLRVRVPLAVKQRGRQLTTSAQWLSFPAHVSRGQLPLLQTLTGPGKKYAVRILRQAPGQFMAYITVDEPVTGRLLGRHELAGGVVAGFDLNLDRLSVAVTRSGQMIAQRDFVYPNLGELPVNKAKALVGSLASQVMDWLEELQVNVVVVEDLEIKPQDGSPGYNRRTHKFAYQRLGQALTRSALRHELAVKYVNPAYTSWIGTQKYAAGNKLSRHQAAAWVVARRGAGYTEKLPKSLVSALPDIVLALEQSPVKVEMCQKWAERLTHWKSFSPSSGRPWLLWVTLYLASKQSSEVRAVLTCGRNFSRVYPRSVDNIQPGQRMGSRPIPVSGSAAEMPPARPRDKARGPA